MSLPVTQLPTMQLSFEHIEQLEHALLTRPDAVENMTAVNVSGRYYSVDCVGQVTERQTFCQRLKSCFTGTKNVESREQRITAAIQLAKVTLGAAEYQVMLEAQNRPQIDPEPSIHEPATPTGSTANSMCGVRSPSSIKSNLSSGSYDGSLFPPSFTDIADLSAVLAAEPDRLDNMVCIVVNNHLYSIDGAQQASEVQSFWQKLKDYFTHCCKSEAKRRAQEVTEVLQSQQRLRPALPVAQADQSSIHGAPQDNSRPVTPASVSRPLSPPASSPVTIIAPVPSPLLGAPLARRVYLSDPKIPSATGNLSPSVQAKHKTIANDAAQRARTDSLTASDASAAATSDAIIANESATAAVFLVTAAMAIRAAVAAKKAADRAGKAASVAQTAAQTADAAVRSATAATSIGVAERASSIAINAARSASSAAALAVVCADQAATAATQANSSVEQTIAQRADVHGD